jgi:hypothetical protein
MGLAWVYVVLSSTSKSNVNATCWPGIAVSGVVWFNVMMPSRRLVPELPPYVIVGSLLNPSSKSKVLGLKSAG